MCFGAGFKRLEVEIIDAVRNAYGLPLLPHDPHWFLSQVFYESTAEWDDPRLGPVVSQKMFDFAKANPQDFFFRYMMETPEETRVTAVRRFTQGAEGIRRGVEERRMRDAAEKESTRRNLLSATMMVNELDEINTWVLRAGIPDVSVCDIVKKHARRIRNDTPTYFIERELTLRLEGQQNRTIQENDFRDMQSFCAVVAYSNIVVAENQFSSLARQAGLDRKYGTIITTSFSKMMEGLSGT